VGGGLVLVLEADRDAGGGVVVVSQAATALCFTHLTQTSCRLVRWLLFAGLHIMLFSQSGQVTWSAVRHSSQVAHTWKACLIDITCDAAKLMRHGASCAAAAVTPGPVCIFSQAQRL
jgi:hypothetical protein